MSSQEVFYIAQRLREEAAEFATQTELEEDIDPALDAGEDGVAVSVLLACAADSIFAFDANFLDEIRRVFPELTSFIDRIPVDKVVSA